MSILTQRAHAPIIAPLFIDTEVNRADLIEKINAALKKHAGAERDMSKLVLSEVYQATGADWLILRDLVKAHSDKLNLPLFQNWFNSNRIFTNLARHLRREINEFVAFSNLFSEFSITLESLYQLTAASKTLDRFGLNRTELLKQINFVANATPETFEMAVPAMFGFLEVLAQYRITAREIDRIDTLVVLDTINGEFVQHFGFDFNEFYADIYLENSYNDGLTVEFDSSDLRMSGIEFEVAWDGENTLQQPVFSVLQQLWRAALRSDTLSMFELTKKARNALIIGGVAYAN